MIRKHESSVSWRAGLLAMLVHVVLLSVLLMSFNWKTKDNGVLVTDVELWDKLPSAQPVLPPPVIEKAPTPEPEPLKPEPKIKKEPEPPPVVEEKPELPKVDIELENKKKALAKKKKEDAIKKKKKYEKQKKLEKKRKTEAAKKAKQSRDKRIREAVIKQDQLDKVRQALDAEQNAINQNQTNAGQASIIGEYINKIKARIRANVNKTACGDGNPELKFEIGLLPTGQYRKGPKLVESSGIAACDVAVERAIILSEPLPLPTDPDALAEFRDLDLTFTPNK